MIVQVLIIYHEQRVDIYLRNKVYLFKVSETHIFIHNKLLYLAFVNSPDVYSAN